jgi:hypothetical protein
MTGVGLLTGALTFLSAYVFPLLAVGCGVFILFAMVGFVRGAHDAARRPEQRADDR